MHENRYAAVELGIGGNVKISQKLAKYPDVNICSIG